MPSPRIRSVSVCICRDGDRILVEHGEDRVTGARFYRAIGGGVEFGERAEDAVRREWMEELGAELDDVHLLGVMENLFTHEGKPGHEVVFVFGGRLRDPARFAAERIELVEADGGRHVASWVALADLTNGDVPFYPRGIIDSIRGGRPDVVPHEPR